MWGQGSDSVGLFPERTPEQDAADLAAARAWAQTVFDAGFGWITGPPAYGGRGLRREYQRIYATVAADYRTPSMSVYGIGLGMVAPTILAHATDEVKEAYLRRMYRGDIVGCQLFSEPSSGSDLASLQTRAVRDGDEWVVNGQKVWTSGAQLSDIGEIICRTDPDLPKHRGLTGFVVDMHAPGVEVRPLRQMTGGASFNEVFFTDVRVPDSHRLGDVNGGWTVALTTLMNERAAIGGGGGGVGLPTSNRLIEMARATGRADDPLVRQQLAAIIINERVARYTNLRAMAKIAVGQLPGPGDVDGQAVAHRQHGAHLRAGLVAARPGAGGRHRCVGHLRLVRVPPRGARACGWPGAPTRSCTTSSANGCSACPRTPPRAESGGRSQRKASSSTKDHERRWSEVRPKPARAVRCTGDG